MEFLFCTLREEAFSCNLEENVPFQAKKPTDSFISRTKLTIFVYITVLIVMYHV